MEATVTKFGHSQPEDFTSGCHQALIAKFNECNSLCDALEQGANSIVAEARRCAEKLKQLNESDAKGDQQQATTCQRAHDEQFDRICALLEAKRNQLVHRIQQANNLTERMLECDQLIEQLDNQLESQIRASHSMITI